MAVCGVVVSSTMVVGVPPPREFLNSTGYRGSRVKAAGSSRNWRARLFWMLEVSRGYVLQNLAISRQILRAFLRAIPFLVPC